MEEVTVRLAEAKKTALCYSATSSNNKTGNKSFNDAFKGEAKTVTTWFPQWTTGVCFSPDRRQMISVYYGGEQRASQGEFIAIISHRTDR